MRIELQGGTYPQAGVIETNPQTIPDAKPKIEAF